MMLRHLKVSGLLSFGPTGIDLPMRRLNVLIGANGSGKSNFIEILNLLRYAPTRLESPIMTGGGIREWIWKGGGGGPEPRTARIEAVVEQRKGQVMGLRHTLEILEKGDDPSVEMETIEHERAREGRESPHCFYRLSGGEGQLYEGEDLDGDEVIRTIERSKLDSRASILSQIKDPDRFQAFDFLQSAYSGIQIFREWCFGPGTIARSAPAADSPTDRVGRRGENLASVIASMPRNRQNRLVEVLKTLYQDIEDIRVAPGAGGNLQLFLVEGDGMEISAARLSDGTLRFLFLLAILLDPAPPRMTVIEEPELGLHPDVIPKIAELLIEASKRTQIVVTTHSRMLVDALGETPEDVIVCGKEDGETRMERLDTGDLNDWLETYSLGDLWSKGEIGGNRW